MLKVALGYARLECLAEDFCLHLPGAHGQLLLLANAYDGGFSTRFPKGSRLFLELFREAWEVQTFQVEQKPRRALRLSFCQSARRFLAKTKGWTEEDAFGGSVSATATAVYVTAQRAICCWLGTEHVGLIRNGCVLVENILDTRAARLGSIQRFGKPIREFSISDQDELEPQLVDWHLPPQPEIVLALKSFPNEMALQELLPLFELDHKQAARWCQKNDTGFYCLMKWTPSWETS